MASQQNLNFSKKIISNSLTSKTIFGHQALKSKFLKKFYEEIRINKSQNKANCLTANSGSNTFLRLEDLNRKIFYFFVVMFLCFAKTPANAAPKNNNLPIILKAKQVQGDQINQEISAKGEVEIKRNSSVFFADDVLYKKKEKKFFANGNLRAKDLEIGNLYAKKGVLSDDFKEGEFLESKIFFNDGSYLFSKKIERKSESITILESPIFSICPNEEIANDYGKADKLRNFATLASSNSIIDREKGFIKSRHSVFKLYGVPIIYTPYSRFAIGGKKRQTGFLNPGYTRNNSFGIGIKIPYFIDIDADKDLTIAPTYFLSNKQILIKNQFRHSAKYGEYSTSLEFANNKTKDASNLVNIGQSSRKLRWNFLGEGNFDFTGNHSADFNINTFSDRNYLRNYNFNGLDRYLAYTSSKASFDYKKGREFYSIKAQKIQELENQSKEKEAQIVLPSVDSHIETKPFFAKEKVSLTSNFTNIYRYEGMGYQRASFIPNAKLPFNLGGNLFEINGRIQGDFYSLQRHQSSNSSDEYKTSIVNQKNELSTEWRLPLIKKSESKTITIEPMANFVVSSFSKSNYKTPNEDSNDSELSVSNLFVSDRVSGFDRNEAGQRMNYGIKSAYFHDYGQFFLTVGQGHRIKNKSQDIAIRGFAENNRSNYVGQATYRAKKYFSTTYAFQLNESNLRNDINQLTPSFEYKLFSFSADYLLIRRTEQISDKREQLSFISGVKIGDIWKIYGSVNIDLITRQALQRSITFERNGCCTSASFSLRETNTNNLVKPQRSFDFNYSFKNL